MVLLLWGTPQLAPTTTSAHAVGDNIVFIRTFAQALRVAPSQGSPRKCSPALQLIDMDCGCDISFHKLF